MPTSSPVSRWVPAASKQRMQSDDNTAVAFAALQACKIFGGNPRGAGGGAGGKPQTPTYVDVPKAARTDLPAQPILALQRGSSEFGCWGGGRGCRGPLRARWSTCSPAVGLTAMRMSMSPRCLAGSAPNAPLERGPLPPSPSGLLAAARQGPHHHSWRTRPAARDPAEAGTRRAVPHSQACSGNAGQVRQIKTTHVQSVVRRALVQQGATVLPAVLAPLLRASRLAPPL